MKEENGINRMFIPVNCNKKNHQKTQPTGTSAARTKSSPLPATVLLLLLCVLFSGSVMAARMELPLQADTYGIKLGMTISEARALMESQGGELKPSDTPTMQWSTHPPQSGKWQYYFRYTATLEPVKKSAAIPRVKVRSRTANGPLGQVIVPSTNTPIVHLFAYPTAKGRTTDPDKLVIYYMQTNLILDPQHEISIEKFADDIVRKYGPVRELVSSGDLADFSVLPDVTTGTSYSTADLISNAAYRKVPRTDKVCSNLRETVLSFTGRPFMGPSTYNLDRSSTAKSKREYIAALRSCGEVTRFFIRINMPANSNMKLIGVTRYSYAHFEQAMRAFAVCKQRGVASCIGPG